MKKVVQAIAVCALIVGPVAALAQSMTYNFTGTITSESSGFSLVGQAVSGTYTFDYDAAIASQSSGTFSTPNWSMQSNGGSALGLPTPAALVFSMTINMLGFSQTTPQPFYTVSSVNAYSNEGPGLVAYVQTEGQNPGGLEPTYEATLQLFGAVPQYSTETGLPILSNDTNPVGSITEISQDGPLVEHLDFTINSLSPVPEPSTASIMFGGLGLLSVFMGQRKFRVRKTSLTAGNSP